MNKQQKFLFDITFLPISLYEKKRIKYLESIGSFTELRLILDKVNDEIENTIDRLGHKRLIANVLLNQQKVCNSMMDYIINMIEISYTMTRDDEERNVKRTINSSS